MTRLDSTRLDDTRRRVVPATAEEEPCVHSGFIKQLYLDRPRSYELKVRAINSRSRERERVRERGERGGEKERRASTG